MENLFSINPRNIDNISIYPTHVKTYSKTELYDELYMKYNYIDIEIENGIFKDISFYLDDLKNKMVIYCYCIDDKKYILNYNPFVIIVHKRNNVMCENEIYFNTYEAALRYFNTINEKNNFLELVNNY